MSMLFGGSHADCVKPMRAQRHHHLIAYQERLRVHHIEESNGETIALVHMAEDSDDKDEA